MEMKIEVEVPDGEYCYEGEWANRCNHSDQSIQYCELHHVRLDRTYTEYGVYHVRKPKGLCGNPIINYSNTAFGCLAFGVDEALANG